MKTKTQKTPGPWHVAKTGNVMDERQCRVATIEQMPGQNEHEQESTAALIAAAPELLEALKWASERVAGRGSFEDYMKCQRAIAKAEGKE